MTRVLIAALDWGLGHASRCVPVVREFQAQGCEVLLAGSGDSLLLLQSEFPELRSFTLPGYEPRYPRRGSMVRAMTLQLPHFMKVIAAEHKAIEKIADVENIDLIISDNRYGCWSEKIHSVFITHQNNILMPKRFGWLQGVVRVVNKRMISRFHSWWIPDFPDGQSLAGDLIRREWSDPAGRSRFVGWLSRFERHANTEKKYDVVAIFSGPEPQRTILENTVAPQLASSGLTYKIVRGLPSLRSEPADETTVNFLGSVDLQAFVEAADVIIARSGYSTVMDMHALGANVVFIPTPGQTEQEYLAQRLEDKGIAFYMKQNEFDLATALRRHRHYTGFRGAPADDMLREAVSSILISIRQF